MRRTLTTANAHLLHRFPQQFGAVVGHLLRQVGHDQDKFLAPVATDNVFGTHAVLHHNGKLAQDRVASLMAKGVIHFLEVIHVEHEDGNRSVMPIRAVQLPLKRNFKKVAIE